MFIGTIKLYLKVQKSYVYRYRKVIIIGTEKLYVLYGYRKFFKIKSTKK